MTIYHPKLKALYDRSDLLRLPRPEYSKSFVHYDPERKRIITEYFWQPLESRLFGVITFGPEAEGPPGCAHGGAIAAILDDCMGSAAWAGGHSVVAVSLEVRFVKFVSLGETYDLSAWIERVEGRKVFVASRIHNDGTVHAEGKGLYLVIDFSEKLRVPHKGPVG
jgi:acyl-coenzyme A thioesterase PaaI-like protein